MYIFIIITIIYIDDSENGLEFWGAHATRLKESQTAASADYLSQGLAMSSFQ